MSFSGRPHRGRQRAALPFQSDIKPSANSCDMQACRSPGGRTTGSAKHLPGTRPEARLCPALLHHASAQPGRAARTRRFTEKMRLGEAGSLSAPGPEAGSTQRRVLGNSTLLLLLCPVGKTKKKIQPPVATAHCIRVSQGIYKAAVSPGPGAGRARSTRAAGSAPGWSLLACRRPRHER